MKKFLISVNGTQYEVDVEEVVGETAAVAAPKAKEQPAARAVQTEAKAPAAAPAPKPKAAPQPPMEAKPGSETISCPMPGTVLKVAVKPGQTVKKNQLLVVIEAMKMENEIVSPRDAVIAGVMVTKGSTLNAGEPMISLE